ncbi:hypothetical protein SAMN05216578_10867 [Halopseudomonas formosensis]|uniref:Uncharacterized protein n=1 Tax=Halopseudomonas formosensis TaxID=1002526 RepID=A0A1I6BYE1_9GAMM|nr:hypothetical protein SAMN05216578_10867 [Halopseudomonas formosensis]
MHPLHYAQFHYLGQLPAQARHEPPHRPGLKSLDDSVMKIKHDFKTIGPAACR